MASSLNAHDPSRFRDDGRRLVERLGDLGQLAPVVVGIAPSGMPIAAEIARLLRAPLDTVAVAPLSIGDNHQIRVGTAADGGVAFLDDEHAQLIDAERDAVDSALITTQNELELRGATWHQGNRRHSLNRRAVLLVGGTLEDQEIAAAACAVRDRGAEKIIYLSPQVRLGASRAVGDWVDRIVCLETVLDENCMIPGTGQQASDTEIHALLSENDGDLHSTATDGPQ